MKSELIRTWKREGFKVELFDLNRRNWGKNILGYNCYDGEWLVFSGDDLGCSPLHAIDSDDSIFALLGFLTLKPGDTDQEYFDDYTDCQLDWCKSGRCEELSLMVYDFEMGHKECE